MKISNYNVFIPWKKPGDYIIFNTITGSEILIDIDIKNILDNFDSHKDDLEKEFIEILLRNGILIDDDTDEKKILQVMREDARFHSTDIRFTVNTSYACNLACVYCFEGKGEIYNKKMNDEITDASIKFIKNMVNKYNRKKLHLTLYGGEPLLNLKADMKLIKEISSWCEETGIEFQCNIFTNGTLITKDLIEKLSSFAISPRVQISVHGPKKIHDKKRIFKNGEGSYETIMHGLKLLKDSKMPFYIAEMIDKDNLHLQEEFLDDLIERGLRNASVDNPSLGFDILDASTKYCKSYESSCLSEKKGERSLIDLKRLAIHKGFEVFSDLILNPIFCSAETKFLFVIDPFGDLYNCPVLMGNKRHRIGSINNKGQLTKITYSYYDFMSRNPLSFEKCKNCKYFPLCGGGCANNAFFKYGTFHRENCTPFEGIEERIKLYLENQKPERK